MLVLIADPDASAREAAADALQRAGFSTLDTETGEQALAIARRERPRIVVVEVCLRGICGYEVCHELKGQFGAELAVILVSGTRKEPHDRVAGLLLGADDYLTKPFAGGELVARLRRFAESAEPLDSRLTSDLTPRERQVFGLLVEGLDQGEIAGRLVISPNTVGTHIEHILGKLRVRSRAQAIALAYQESVGAAERSGFGISRVGERRAAQRGAPASTNTPARRSIAP